MRILKEHRISITAISDEIIDRILNRSSNLTKITLSTLLVLERLRNESVNIQHIANILYVPDTFIDDAIEELIEIGYLKITKRI